MNTADIQNNTSLEEILVHEAKEVYQLLQQSDQQFRKKTDIKICYLLSRKWFTAWSEYVGYAEISAGIEPNMEKFCIAKPPEIINSEVAEIQGDMITFIAGGVNCQLPLMQFEESRVSEAEILNVNVGKDAGSSVFRIVNANVWNYFVSKYPGSFAIPRQVFYYKNKMVTDLQLVLPEIGVISEDQWKDASKKIEWKKCQLPGLYTVKQLKEMFCKQFEVNTVRILKYDPSIKRDEVQQQIVQSLKQQDYRLRARELVEKIENKEIVLRDLIKNHYTLIIELPSKGQFRLRLQQGKQVQSNPKTKGICEFCTKISELKVKCLCQEVSYCSQDCKYKDQDFHSQICEVAADSASDEEISQLPLEISGKTGLKNIGNTCYLAAALQNLYFTKEFSQAFTMNQIIPIAQHEGSKLVQKFSKLFKEMAMQDEAHFVEPWSFKTQFARINPMFSGNQQQDACEFLTCLIDSLDEASTKKKVTKSLQLKPSDIAVSFWKNVVANNYSEATLNSFLGLLQSNIECPGCGDVSTSYEPFTVLSLPIKQKPVQRTISVNYVSSDILKEITHNRTTYTTGETNISDLIKIVCELNEVTYVNNVVACTFDGQTLIQSYFRQDQLAKKVEDLETELDGRNKALVFFQVDFDTSTFDPMKHKLIKLEFAKLGKVQLGIMSIDGKVNFSFPRIIIQPKSASLSNLYISLFSMLKQLYPNSLDILGTAFKEIQEPEIKQIDTQFQPKQVDNQEIKNDQDISKKQPEIVGDGWNDYQSIITTSASSSKKSSQANQSSVLTANTTGVSQNKPTENGKVGLKTESNNKSSVQNSQSNAKKIEEDKSQASQRLQEIETEKATLEKNNVVQPAAEQKAATSSGGDWGWETEIVVIPKKTPAVTQKTTPVVNNSQQQQPQKQIEEQNEEKDEFTQVTKKQKQPHQKGGKQQYQQQQYYQAKGTANNNQIYSQKQESKQTNPTSYAPKNEPAAGKDKNVGTKNQKINTLAGWGDDDDSITVDTASTSTSTTSIKTQQNSQQKVSENDQKGIQKGKTSENTTKQQDSSVQQGQQPQQQQQQKSGHQLALEKRAKEKAEEDLKIQKEKEQEAIRDMLKLLPCSVMIKSQKRRGIGGQFKCFFCSKSNCQNCQLPFDNQQTLQQFLGNYRDSFDLELYWHKEQPEKALNKTIVDQGQAQNQAKKLNLPTLQYCLEEFSKKEQLSVENAWFCSKCQVNQQALKSLNVRMCPRNLIIQLKRFRTNDQTGLREKNSQQVLFPSSDWQLQSDHLSLTPSINSPELKNSLISYELYGVIVHEGTTENGHYIAHCKQENQWYNFNDENVSIIETEKVLNNKNAYILFYRLQSKPKE